MACRACRATEENSMTAQIPDRLRWNGENRSLMGDLPLPATRWLIVERDDHSMMSTACWRGYVAS